MPAYYDEIEPYCAAWLRNLIRAGLIPAGDVDERSIVDVSPDDLAGYDQCHFFAGIGGWSEALRLAGWDAPVWTGSCPCQPLSSAGARRADVDERHLWPAFYRLIAERRPATLIGEQVASKLGREWLSGVRADLEGLGYAVGATDLPAACVGAPHIRQRLFWVADTTVSGRSERSQRADRSNGRPTEEPGRLRRTGGLADPDDRGRDPGERCDGPAGGESDIGRSGRLGDASGTGLPAPECEDLRRAGRRQEGRAAAEPDAPPLGRGLGHAAGGQFSLAQRIEEGRARDSEAGTSRLGDADRGRREVEREPEHAGEQRSHRLQPDGSGPPGFWDGAVWIPCADGKARRVEPSIFPLAHGVSARVAKLRAAGNAIVPQAAAAFVSAYMRCRP